MYTHAHMRGLQCCGEPLQTVVADEPIMSMYTVGGGRETMVERARQQP